MSILKYLASQFELVKDDVRFRKLTSSSTGVYLSSKKLFNWTEISSIEAYKRDMVTQDLICLDIYLSTGIILTLHEELKGYETFKTIMHQQLSLNKDWMLSVISPPFEECRTQVYNGT